jgi:hypothetical protein
VTANLSKKSSETFGDDVANELVERNVSAACDREVSEPLRPEGQCRRLSDAPSRRAPRREGRAG